MKLDPQETAFRHWWLAYPLKIAVAEARVAFGKALNLTTAGNLIESAHRFAGDPNRDPHYTPYPAKWLENQRWMDGPLPPRKLTPEEIAAKDLVKSLAREKAERERSEQIEREFLEARAKAVPLDPSLKARTLEIIAKNCYPES